MSKILVTGGAGFIGSNLVRALLEKGNQVVVIDNLITGQEQNIAPLLAHPHFTFIRHDITQPFSGSTNQSISHLDMIYHLACPTGVPNLTTLAEEMLTTCTLGTINVLEHAKNTNARVVFTSSSEVYGNPEKEPQNEQYTGNVDPRGIRSPYEEGKRCAESIVMMYVRKYDINAGIVRIFNTYGSLMSCSDMRVIPLFFHQISSGKPLTVHGDGKQKRTFCYVDDLVSGLEIVMKKGKKGQVYNLGSDKQVNIYSLAKLILKVVNGNGRVANGATKIVHVQRPSHDHNSRLPDLFLVKKLGWYPTISLHNGLSRTLKWYNKQQ